MVRGKGITMNFKISWENVLLAIEGSNFAYTGKLPSEFIHELKKTREIIVAEFAEDIEDVLYKKVFSGIEKKLPFIQKEAFNTLANREEFLDTLVDRINKRQITC